MLTGVLFSLILASSSAQESSLVVDHCDLGAKYQFAIATCKFKLQNNSDIAIEVQDIKSPSEGDEISATRLTIPPNESREIQLTVNVGARLGRYVRFVTFKSSGESRKLIATGFALSDLNNAAQRIDFGIVDSAVGSESKTIQLTSNAVADFKVIEITDVPSWVEARIESDQRTISAKVLPGAPWIPSDGYLKLKVNSPHQKQVWVAVTANLQGSVIPNANPFEIGAVHEGEITEFAVRLTSQNGKPFKVGKVSSRGVEVKISQLPCTPNADDCRLLKVRLPSDMSLGMFRGDILVELPEYDRTLPIAFGGLLVAKTTEIRKVPETISSNVVDSKDSDRQKTDAALPSVPPVNLSGVLRNSALQASVRAAQTPPEGSGPLLKWQVANEQQVYGYLINRADIQAGPFVRVNKEIIRVASDGEGWSYQWRDTSAESGKAYWYFISVINQSGQIEPLSGPQKIAVK